MQESKSTFKPIRAYTVITQEETRKEAKKEPLTEYQEGKKKGKIVPAPGGYEWLTKQMRIKIIRSPRGKKNFYEFMPMSYELSEEERKLYKKQEALSLPNNTSLQVQYLSGIIKIYLEKHELGRTFIECETEVRAK